MKTTILSTILLFFIYFHCFGDVGHLAITDTIRSSDNKSYVFFIHIQKELFWNVPNKITVKGDKIKNITVDGGSFKVINDSVFEVKPTSKKEINLKFKGNKQYFKTFKIVKLPPPEWIKLKGDEVIDNEELITGLPQCNVYTLADLTKSNQLYGNWQGYKYKVTQFNCPYGYNGDMRDSIPGCYIFNDRIPNEYIKYLNTKDGDANMIMFSMHNIHFISPDSTEVICKSLDFGIIVKDSTSLILAKYDSRIKVHSDVRIKISGNATNEDRKTINEIINELNAYLPGIKVKLVNYLPSLTIIFDSISPYFSDKDEYMKFNFHEWKNTNLFYPSLSNIKFNINYKTYNQKSRDSILWRGITRSLFFQGGQIVHSQKSMIIGDFAKNELTYEDKLALKTIFSYSNTHKMKEIYNVNVFELSINIFFTILILIIVFLILREIISYYNINHIVSNNYLLNGIYAVTFTQIVLFVIWSFDHYSFNKYSLLQYDIYFSSLALIVSQMFLVSNMLNKKITIKWLRLCLNPFPTILTLYLAYQIVYLFVRGEILRFVTIDINAITIGASIVLIRFLTEYQNLKMATLMQEKEYELTKHKELQSRAELNALQARINPHFLYNALNSIATLANINPKRTENMAMSLSKLFRYNVNREEQLLTTLGQEIEIVQLYLDIEKQRFGDRFKFDVVADTSLYDRQIPRFLIQPLIENAIKHGISKITENGIVTLKVYEADKKLIIEVYDNGPAFQDGLISGYGLQNIYDKLNIVNKKPYEVKFVNSPEKYIQIKL